METTSILSPLLRISGTGQGSDLAWQRNTRLMGMKARADRNILIEIKRVVSSPKIFDHEQWCEGFLHSEPRAVCQPMKYAAKDFNLKSSLSKSRLHNKTINFQRPRYRVFKQSVSDNLILKAFLKVSAYIFSFIVS